MYERILIASDGSDPANRAVEFGVDLAAQYGGTVYAIDVVNTDRYGEPALSSSELVLDEIEDRARTVLAEIEEVAEAEDIDVETRCCHGTPHEEILSYADEVDADVVVMGFQGRTQTGDHVGSIANRVLNGTDRPVLLV